jgi:hypothetical protein
MKKILVPIKSKLKPIEVNEEIEKFKKIYKSPYSQTYYDTGDISWDYKPEGSLRISDHWNFESHGQKHCVLESTDEYVQDNWVLAQYREGKYYILKEFGNGIDGYIYTELYKKQIEVLEKLYELGGIEKTYDWYKKYRIRPPFVREGYMKNPQSLSRYISIDKINKFKSKKPKAKKIIFIEDKYIEKIEKVLYILKKSKDLDKIVKDKEKLKTYNAYKLKKEREESVEEIYTLILENDIAIDFRF